MALHIDSKLLLFLPIPRESSVRRSAPSSQGSSTFVVSSANRACQSVLLIALHIWGPLPPAPQRTALCLPRATLEVPVDMIGHFLWSSLLINIQLSSLVRKSADGKTTKHRFTSFDYTCIWKPHPWRITLSYSDLLIFQQFCILLRSHPMSSNWWGNTPSPWM